MSAQSTLQCKTIPEGSDFILLDSLPVDKESISLSYDVEYSLVGQNTKLVFTEPISESIEVCYRYINKEIREKKFVRDISLYERGVPVRDQLSFNEKVKEQSLFSTPGLYKSGTISRGITVGSRQNLFVNSTLNLQLNGKLSEDLNIRAVITDQNVPYQPEGNTQQIRDFDNVYIQLFNDNINLLAGDIVLRNPDHNYFLKYYKNQQGVQLSYKSAVGEKWTSTSKVSAAFAKGKFASIRVDPIEGVSGPYRLRGAQNERFIIILANSEKVFIDGRQLERGFDKDYIIDYNLGEIIFNPNIAITRFTRIRVDFEYSEQNYSRSNLLVSQVLESSGATIYGEFYRERDNPETSFGFDLDSADLRNLENIGDNLDQALISGADSAQFAEGRIFYMQKDTVVDGITYQIYEYSPDDRQGLLTVDFTEAGIGNGDYVLLNTTSNGRIFEWVAPINGVSQGNYVPFIPITTPNSRQMGVIGARISISEHEEIFQEVAFSMQDQNLFSDLDDQNNNGFAWKGGLATKGRSFFLDRDYELASVISFEFNNADFRPIDRFRYIEFNRDWNYRSPYDSSARVERIFHGEFKLEKNSKNNLTYEINYRQRGTALSGFQHRINANKDLRFLHYSGQHFFMNNEQKFQRAQWNRSFSTLTTNTNPIEFGIFYNLDQNSIFYAASDSVISTAMYFTESGVLVKNSDTARFHLESRVGKRIDKSPVGGDLEDLTVSQFGSLSFSSPQSSRQRFQTDLVYREIEDLQNDDLSTRIIQGKIIAENSLLGGIIHSNLNYGTSNARELRREFVFTQVGSGQGTHTWRDENNDGVQDLNEFYEAINPDERNYIKLFVPTDEYIEAFQSQYNHTINVRFPGKWSRTDGFLQLIRKISFLANWNINRKTTSENNNDRLNPFIKLEGEELLSEQSIKRYNVFFNRAGTGIGLDIGYSERANRQLNQNGFEALNEDQFETLVRWNINRKFQTLAKWRTLSRENESDFLESRNFFLEGNSYSPEFIWQPNFNWRFRVKYNFKNSVNTAGEDGREFSRINEWGSAFTWSNAQKGSFNADLSYLKIEFEGEEDTFLGYTLLEGLQPGNNLRVSLNWQQNLKNGLQLTMQYFGRKSEENPMIHSGTIQLTAFF